MNMVITPGLQATADAEHPAMVITKKDRRLQLVKLFVIAFVSMGTVALTLIDVIQTAELFEKKHELTHNVQASIETALIIHELQKERGMTALQLGFKQLKYKEERLRLREIRQITDRSIVRIEKTDDAELILITGAASSFREVLEEYRNRIDHGEIDVIQQLQIYRSWITQLISKLTKYTESQSLEDYSDMIYAYRMVILSKEEVGMERALGGLKFTQGKNFSIVNTTWYNEKRILASNYLKTAFLFSSELKSIHTILFHNTSHWMKKLEEKRKILSRRSYSKSSDDTAYEWFDLMTKYNNLMLKLQIRQANLIQAKVNNKIIESTNQLVIRSLLLCFTLIVVPCIIVSLGRVQKSFYEYTLSLFDKVGLEQARTDFLMRENLRHVESKLFHALPLKFIRYVSSLELYFDFCIRIFESVSQMEQEIKNVDIFLFIHSRFGRTLERFLQCGSEQHFS